MKIKEIIQQKSMELLLGGCLGSDLFIDIVNVI
jgi:hypothetical protein